MGAPDFDQFYSLPNGDAQQASAPESIPTAADENELARKLDVVTGHALDKIDELLVMATDVNNGNLVRGQVAAATAALNTASKVDELRLRERSNPDIMARIVQMMAEEKEKLRLLENAEGGITEMPWTPENTARPK
jgi:hypothetical protein